MSEKVLVLGAGAAIGRAIVHELASLGVDVVLAGRRREELEREAADVELRSGVCSWTRCFDALDFDSHRQFFEDCVETATGLDGVVVCFGDDPGAGATAQDRQGLQHLIALNYAAPVSLLDAAADYFEVRGKGWLCVVTSVAGDRGRPSNHLYGSTKAALSTYLEGLRARLARAGVSVTDVRPGMVDTGLTYGREGMFALASPAKVARDAVRAARRGRAVVYTPGFWRLVMSVIRWLPEPIFRRLPL